MRKSRRASMTRQHFEAIATAIRNYPAANLRKKIAKACVPALKQFNPTFNEKRFVEAASVGKRKRLSDQVDGNTPSLPPIENASTLWADGVTEQAQVTRETQLDILAGIVNANHRDASHVEESCPVEPCFAGRAYKFARTEMERMLTHDEADRVFSHDGQLWLHVADRSRWAVRRSQYLWRYIYDGSVARVNSQICRDSYDITYVLDPPANLTGPSIEPDTDRTYHTCFRVKFDLLDGQWKFTNAQLRRPLTPLESAALIVDSSENAFIASDRLERFVISELLERWAYLDFDEVTVSNDSFRYYCREEMYHYVVDSPSTHASNRS